RSQAGRKVEAAWRLMQQGQTDQADRRLADIERRDPTYRPATLARAGIALQSGNTEKAAELIAKSRGDLTDYTAADVYAAELAIAQGDLKTAYQRYQIATHEPGAPAAVGTRTQDVRKQLFDQLFAASTSSAADEQAIASLREALSIYPESETARISLVRRLIAARRYEEGRRELDPIFMRGLTDRPDVQEALADIDVGRGRFQEAITRLDRLYRSHPEARYAARLQEIKDEYALANMPPQYARALESSALTRADAAVLIYWTLSAVRFAQNLSQPPIAVDITNVMGREELIRALALRLYNVDPITRTASPNRVITASSFVRLAASLLTLRGTPACGSALPEEPNDLLRAQKLLEACGTSTTELLASPEAPVSGRQAKALLEKLESIPSAEKR
ncbi:MAG TPA: tetratricopeptide repeat protein, partial [Thermoanaerobaculia bacterium]|nr:tetratricopeptide repeat protein [Thermoanaerobaculia bacterium]